jgi:glycosyltransferase involved in cell wall biosynthesis
VSAEQARVVPAVQVTGSRISVIVFVLNAAPTIEKALQSVTSADQPPVELLVLDGGSTDGTVDIIRRFERHITFWRSHPDGNASNAVNEGVKRATGDIICLLPADDWIEPAALHSVRDAFAADPELDVLSCGTRIVSIGADGTVQIDAEFMTPSILELRIENILRYPLTAGRFIRRRIYLEVGEFDAAFGSSNDLDFLVKVINRKPRSQVLPRLVYSYRRHEGSQTISGNPKMVMAMMRNNICIAEHHLQSAALAREFRSALRGLHGRASTRLVWMLAARARVSESAQVLGRALIVNPLLPFKAVLWVLQKWLGYVPKS